MTNRIGDTADVMAKVQRLLNEFEDAFSALCATAAHNHELTVHSILREHGRLNLTDRSTIPRG